MIGTQYPDKEFATARATAALNGIILQRMQDDQCVEVFVATRGPVTKMFDTLPGFIEWMERMEARG